MPSRTSLTIAAVLAGVLMLGGAFAGGQAFAANRLTAHLTGPERVMAGHPFMLDASSSTGDGLRFAWNFGDDTFLLGDETEQHVYSQPGIYTVIVDVADADGHDADATLTITVVEEPEGPAATVVAPGDASDLVPADMPEDTSGKQDVVTDGLEDEALGLTGDLQ